MQGDNNGETRLNRNNAQCTPMETEKEKLSRGKRSRMEGFGTPRADPSYKGKTGNILTITITELQPRATTMAT
jgi:hypothetical protein